MKNKLYISDVGSFAVNGRSTGHFIPLAQNYKEVLDKHFHVIVAGGPTYKEAFDGKQLLQLPYNNTGSGWRDKIHILRNCSILFKAAQNEVILLQQSSITTAFIGIFLFYRRKSKLFVIEYSSSSINSRIKKVLYRLAKNKIDGFLCPSESVGKAFDRPFCVVPDYIYTEKTQSKKLPYSEKKYDFCIIGRLAPEKGAIEVAKRFANLGVSLLIAGRPQSCALKEEIEAVCANAPNIKLHLGFIERKDYETYLRESRYAILNYQGEYSVRSSGVVFDTLFNDVPVIGCRCSALQFIEDNNCGVLYDNLEDFNPGEVLNQAIHEDFVRNISAYRQSHAIYRERLIKFLSNI